MLGFLLGISITFNIIAIIGYLIIYKYSLKGFKNKLENKIIKNFCSDDIDIMEVFNNDNK